ncbi:MAG: AEC family transporter, partial [Bacillota bacterium]|nr:AEC family transporter [Bacillota bacterium]
MYSRYFVLFAILFTGWFLRKINFIDDQMNHSINKLIVYFAYPCMIVHNIGSLEMGRAVVEQFLTVFVISLVCFYLYGAVSWAYAKARRFPKHISNVAEFAMSMPNDGFMGCPVAIFLLWVKGLLLMLAHKESML